MPSVTEAAHVRDALVPDDGRAGLVLPGGWAYFVRWGTDGDIDRVATADCQVVTYGTAHA